MLICFSNTPLAELPALKATERNLGTGFLYARLKHGGKDGVQRPLTGTSPSDRVSTGWRTKLKQRMRKALGLQKGRVATQRKSALFGEVRNSPKTRNRRAVFAFQMPQNCIYIILIFYSELSIITKEQLATFCRSSGFLMVDYSFETIHHLLLLTEIFSSF